VIGEQSFDDLLASEAEPPTVTIDPAEDVVVLPYSSGTTGVCKGVMLTHRNLVANICQLGAHLGADEKTVALGVLPFFHIYGLVVVLNNTLREGGTVVTMPRFDLEGMLTAIEQHRITHAFVVPPIVLALAKQAAVEEHDLSVLHFVMSGAAPLGADLEQECIDRLGVTFRQGYGLTETSPVTHMVPHVPGFERLGSVGPPVPNSEVKIVDPLTGDEAAPGERGEVWVRGPHVMKGYLANEVATAMTVDSDGWLHTGDIGLADAEGYLTVVDRMKELIKVKGYQVAPAQLEAVLLQHPAIADAAVIGVPDEEAGELPKAFVVLREPGTSAEAIIADTARQLAPHQRIRRLEFVDAIPKSPSGKILRRELRARSATR